MMDLYTKLRLASVGERVTLDHIEAAKLAQVISVLQRVADNDCTNHQREAETAVRLVTQ